MLATGNFLLTRSFFRTLDRIGSRCHVQTATHYVMRFLHAQRLDQNQTYFACWKCFEKLVRAYRMILGSSRLVIIMMNFSRRAYYPINHYEGASRTIVSNTPISDSIVEQFFLDAFRFHATKTTNSKAHSSAASNEQETLYCNLHWDKRIHVRR